MNAYQVAEILADMAKNGEDGTVSVSGNPLPTEGYWVGGVTPSLVFDGVVEVDRGEIAWWIGSNDRTSKFYGVWVDGETDKVYFDAVTHMDYEKYAIQLAKARNEIAIWDIANSQEIRVEGNPHLEPWQTSE